MLVRLGVFLLWLIHFLPFRIIVAIGNGLGFLLYHLAKERRRVGMINLQLCFPDMSEDERKGIVHDHFKVLARSLIERSLLWWASSDRINSLIRVEGMAHFESVRGRPAIFLTPHFVALDAAGQWIAQRMDSMSMYANQKNPYMTRLLLEKRARFGRQLLYSRQQGLRPVIKAMRQNIPFFYLPDQDQGIKDGVFVPFFGVQAATMTSVSRIAKMTGAIVVPCVAKMLPGGEGYVVTFYPAWENFPGEDETQDARRMNEFIEARVLEMPEQYFWLHKRFKTRPEGEKKFY